MRAVHVTPYDIPEIGARAGDTIIVRPTHPETPLVVARGDDRNRLPLILDHLRPVDLPGAHQHDSSTRRWLRRYLSRERLGQTLRVVP